MRDSGRVEEETKRRPARWIGAGGAYVDDAGPDTGNASRRCGLLPPAPPTTVGGRESPMVEPLMTLGLPPHRTPRLV